MRARARPCAPVSCAHPSFELTTTPKRGAAHPPPRLSQLHCFLFDPQKYIKSIQLRPPRSRTFFFPLYRRGYEVPCPPSRRFRQYFGVKSIYQCDNTHQFFRFFFSLVFGSFPFVILFFFFSPFQFLLILLFLSLFIHFVGLYFVFLFFSSYIFNCLSHYIHAY